MTLRPPILACAAVILSCGGSITANEDGGSAGPDASRGGNPSSPDGSLATDAGADSSACPPGTEVPDAAVYMCEAGAPGAPGCPPMGTGAGSSGGTVSYPEGCMVVAPIQGAFCDGTCCGPLTCTCQTFPTPTGTTLSFVCPD
jgi:hypothetical protein